MLSPTVNGSMVHSFVYWTIQSITISCPAAFSALILIWNPPGTSPIVEWSDRELLNLIESPLRISGFSSTSCLITPSSEFSSNICIDVALTGTKSEIFWPLYDTIEQKLSRTEGREPLEFLTTVDWQVLEKSNSKSICLGAQVQRLCPCSSNAAPVPTNIRGKRWNKVVRVMVLWIINKWAAEFVLKM